MTTLNFKLNVTEKTSISFKITFQVVQENRERVIVTYPSLLVSYAHSVQKHTYIRFEFLIALLIPCPSKNLGTLKYASFSTASTTIVKEAPFEIQGL